LQEDSS